MLNHKRRMSCNSIITMYAKLYELYFILYPIGKLQIGADSAVIYYKEV